MRSTNVCAIIGWGSPGWTMKIAEAAASCFAAKRLTSWEVALEYTGRRRSVSVVEVPVPEMIGTPAFRLHVVDAPALRRVAQDLQEDLARSWADYAIVDCTIDVLAEASRSVQALPRWPLAWLPRLGAVESFNGGPSLEALINKLTGRLESLPVGELALRA